MIHSRPYQSLPVGSACEQLICAILLGFVFEIGESPLQNACYCGRKEPTIFLMLLHLARPTSAK